MFSILDMPQFTTLEQTREAIRFGGINLDEVVQYLRAGNKADRLAQPDHYQKLARKARSEKIIGVGIFTIIILALAAPWFIL